MYSLLLITLFLAVAFATSESEYQAAFTKWMHDNTKSYAASEFQTRYVQFKSNFDFVNTWDAEAKGFEVALNKFADLSLEEFSKTYLGVKYDASKHTRTVASSLPAPPAAIDWRTSGYVTPIKDQGQCGSCWSFSTTGSTEGANFKKTQKLVSFSEQELVDCSASFGNQGCDGGLMDSAFKYIIANGIVAEEAYPYTAQDGTCNLSGKTKVGTVSAYTDVTSGSESDLVAAIGSIGPISVAIDASHSSFQLYSSGVYYESQCSTSALDHGVLAVGYGANGNKDFYIVKNSWGTVWGTQGYINMARNRDNNCGIATMASYPVA